MWRSSRACYAAANRRTLITYDSCSLVHLAARRATNSWSRCAAPHHRAAHRVGDDRAWWTAGGIDPVKVARKLWKETLADKRLRRPHVLASVWGEAVRR